MNALPRKEGSPKSRHDNYGKTNLHDAMSVVFFDESLPYPWCDDAFCPIRKIIKLYPIKIPGTYRRDAVRNSYKNTKIFRDVIVLRDSPKSVKTIEI